MLTFNIFNDCSTIGVVTFCIEKLWRSHKVMQVALCDIYDGRIWKEFMNPDVRSFLLVSYNFVLALNVDWFQPFITTTYVCGAMYVSIL